MVSRKGKEPQIVRGSSSVLILPKLESSMDEKHITVDIGIKKALSEVVWKIFIVEVKRLAPSLRARAQVVGITDENVVWFLHCVLSSADETNNKLAREAMEFRTRGSLGDGGRQDA